MPNQAKPSYFIKIEKPCEKCGEIILASRYKKVCFQCKTTRRNETYNKSYQARLKRPRSMLTRNKIIKLADKK